MKKTDKQWCIESCRNHVEKILDFVYRKSHNHGVESTNERIEKMRASCQRIAGEHDAEYADGWGDHTDFYGWCNQCEHPHSGRHANLWEFCPWCGAKIDWNHEQPYPMGYGGKEGAK